MHSDTERLWWYVKAIADGLEPLSYRLQADAVMGVTAFGEATHHPVWHWPFDRSNKEYADWRDALDAKMECRSHPDKGVD